MNSERLISSLKALVEIHKRAILLEKKFNADSWLCGFSEGAATAFTCAIAHIEGKDADAALIAMHEDLEKRSKPIKNEEVQ